MILENLKFLLFLAEKLLNLNALASLFSVSKALTIESLGLLIATFQVIIDDIDDSANIYTDTGDNDNSGYDMDLDTDVGNNVNWEIDRDYMDSNEGEGYNDEY